MTEGETAEDVTVPSDTNQIRSASFGINGMVHWKWISAAHRIN